MSIVEVEGGGPYDRDTILYMQSVVIATLYTAVQNAFRIMLESNNLNCVKHTVQYLAMGSSCSGGLPTLAHLTTRRFVQPI